MSKLLNLYKYKFFVLSSIKKEFVSKFVRSRLGGVWLLLHPLAFVLVYSIVLSQIMKAKLPGVSSQYAYSIYIMSGLLCWNMFLEIFNKSINVFIDNAGIIKKEIFPRITLLFIIVGSAIMNNVILIFSMVIVSFALGHELGASCLFFPLLVVLTALFSASVGFVFGVFNVFIRDVGQVMKIVVQFLFWLTPIVYPYSIIPEKYEYYMQFNPLVPLVRSYHDIFVYNEIPSINFLLYPIVVTFLFSIFGIYIYQKAKNEMADVL